jgi:hypothetical protein
MNQADVAVVKEAYAAYGRGDVDAILRTVTPDVDWELVGQPEVSPAFGRRKGVDQAREFFQVLAETEEYSEFTPKEFVPAEDRIFVLGHAEGRLKQTGDPISGDWIHIFTVRDGKISSWRGFTDTAQYAAGLRH